MSIWGPKLLRSLRPGAFSGAPCHDDRTSASAPQHVATLFGRTYNFAVLSLLKATADE